MSEENLCILIDFENIAAGTERENLGKFNIRMVMNRLKEKGRVLVSRAYGDWGRFAKFKQSMLEHGVTMMELTSYRGQEKNRADTIWSSVGRRSGRTRGMAESSRNNGDHARGSRMDGATGCRRCLVQPRPPSWALVLGQLSGGLVSPRLLPC